METAEAPMIREVHLGEPGTEATGENAAGITVLIAVDGSSQSDSAFNWYMETLHRPGNQVRLIHGVEIPSVPTRDSWDLQMTAGNKKRQELQDKYAAKFKELKISGKFVSDFERPGELIVGTAALCEAKYVVMGTRGQGKMRRTVMGSVSDYVVHHAHCPVIICRN